MANGKERPVLITIIAILYFVFGVLMLLGGAGIGILGVAVPEAILPAAAVGGIIAVAAIIIHKELLIPILCFIFFMESVSVLLQTEYARMGNKRGKKWRVFKRAPIHDTFRVAPGQLPTDFKVLINWPKGCWLESKIIVRFWIITIILASLAIVTLKIR